MYIPDAWYEDAVNPAQFDVDLEAEVGEGLGGRLQYILHLNTLRGHSKESVTYTLHLGWGGGK